MGGRRRCRHAEEAERTGQPLWIVHGGEDRGTGEVVRARLADHEHTIRDIARRLRTAIPGSTLQPELIHVVGTSRREALLRNEPLRRSWSSRAAA
ncbi:hypothetical protein Q0F99_17900 [Rathayibacter oskolensis]|uniref:hypothetical protein n=1 Tax=Rathayibacter oskolensis TaxID=1891671 RepID=UPI00265DD5C1|nr:hypothetical protein [Rathayibacter oskolensis]WKK71300.1 hypothetical protein Q0F99_17900 [Rathayibacter oskolensis]